MPVVRPITETFDSVTLRRVDFERLVDAADVAHAKSVEIKAKSGETEYLPVSMVNRLAHGEAAVLVWREYRGLTRAALAKAAGVSASWLCEIETGK